MSGHELEQVLCLWSEEEGSGGVWCSLCLTVLGLEVVDGGRDCGAS